jgi:hypothetical protein
MKDYGHYGPHSANDRPRRHADWKPLFEGYILIARFEEWSLVGISLRRTVRICEYNSARTNLWHKDDFGDMFMGEAPFGAALGYGCPVTGCYYHSPPPQNCQITLFKSIKGLQEHSRRVHDAKQFSLPSSISYRSQLYRDEDRGSVCSSNTMAPSVDMGNMPLSSTNQLDQPWLRDLDLSIGTPNFSAQCPNPGCIQYRRQGDQQTETSTSEDLYLGDQILGWCHSCFQREQALQPPDSKISFPESGLSSEFELTSFLPPNAYATTSLPTFDISEDTTQTTLSTTGTNISSLSREDSLKLR